ncbi:MAG: ATP-binding protein, partial [Myxococcota bacterium]
MSERRRKREGRHVSVGGAAADEVLESLVKQFADRYAFIRELLQNSLDAGAARIDVVMTWDGRELCVEVRDDGEGMDRPIIEGYLLTLFRSTKEDDLTKIGKFGIGFTSIFAMEPFEVIVDTGRDGVWHRVTFDEARAYTLSRLADPYEGTTVTLRMARGRAAATEDARKIRAAALRWCRYADATITTSAHGTDEEWDATPVAAPFTVDAPVVVTEESDGLRVVLGPHRAPSPPIGFYNRGITLWEGEDDLLPGVCFRAAGRHLEHTLTRDNVIRDRHFDHVVAAVHAAAETRLGDAVHAEAAAAATAGDLARATRLFAAIHAVVPWTWREDAPLLPGHGRALSIADLRGKRGWLGALTGSGPTVWWAPRGCPVAAAAAATGVPIVLAALAEDPHLEWAVRTLGGARRAVTDGYFLTTAAKVDGPVAALIAAADALPADVRGGGLEERLAVALPGAWGLGKAPLPAP